MNYKFKKINKHIALSITFRLMTFLRYDVFINFRDLKIVIKRLI